MSDVRDRLGHEQDDPVDEHDLDEAQQVLMAVRRWVDLDQQRAYGDADLETQIFERKDKALRDFTDWLRAFVVAQVDRKLGYAIEAAMNDHKRQEWHR